MNNLSNLIRSRAARFVSLRVVLILCAVMILAGFGAASAWSGGISWLSMRTASAESNVSASAPAVSAPLAPGTCENGNNPALPIEVESLTGTAGGTPTSYASLGAAFTAINGGVIHTGAITIDVCENSTEGASAALNQVAGVGPVTISPVGTRTISGAVAGPLVDLNGADGNMIDGLGTLTIENTLSAATPSAIRFINDASSNTVQNCIIKSAETSTTLGTIFFSTGTTTGNDSNIITGNTITSSGSNFATNAIYSLGTSAAIDNSGNTVSSNNISDYFSATLQSVGINLGATGNSGWTITGNRLFQSANRVFTAANTHNGIFVGVGSGYTINNNIIGFATSAGTGTTNLAGITTLGTFSGTFPSSYALGTATLNATRYIGINVAFTAGGAVSNIQNNTIGGIALLTSSGATTTNGIVCGINLTSGNANIGTTLGNTIGATSGTSSIYAATNTSGGIATGIYATSTNTVTIQNNTIGAFDVVGTTATQAGAFNGIDTAGAAGVFNISTNFIGNTTADNIRTGYTLSGANLSNAGTLTSTTGSGTTVLIRSTATGATLTMSSNTLRGVATSSTAQAITGMTSTGAVTSSLAMNSNALGTAALGWIRYAFANSGTLTGINASGTAAAATLSVSTNDFRGIVHSVAGSNSQTYIAWNHAASSTDNINSNTFTNLNVNTSGSITFLSRGTTNMAATAVLSVSNNQIVTGFNKGTAGGTVTFHTNSTGASSPNGTTILENLNNFSNVTLTGATAVLCWSDADGPGGGGPTKTITNNTFNNITTGAAQVTGISPNFSGASSTTSNNAITNITNAGVILGINIGSSNALGTHTVANNTITGLTSTGGAINAIQGGSASIITLNVNNNLIDPISTTGGAFQINGIIITAGTTVNIFKNKIYDLQSTDAGASVNGIAITAGTTHNIFNNLIGDLRTPSANAAAPLAGLSIGAATTVNVYYNTVYLNGTSSAALFGSTAITASTTPTLDLRNNLFVNTSTPKGAGLSVAYRRSTTTLTTYAAASDRNDFFAPTIFTDGTNTFSVLGPGAGTYKNFVSPRDTNSLSVAAPFLSTTSGNINFLKINPAAPTQLESGGANVGGITDDFENDIRAGNGGYPGSGTAPDIGADEFNGTPAVAMSYVSSTTEQITGNAFAGVNNQPIIRVKVVTSGSLSPLSLTSLTLNANGTTAITDINATTAKVYYTGASTTFSTATLFGATTPTIANFVVTGTQTLGEGDNYFWLAYDVIPSAMTGNVIDGECNSITVVTPFTPTVTAPAGNKTILGPLTGTYNIGAAQVSPNYTTITSALADLGNRGVSGPVTFVLMDTLYSGGEAFPLTINPYAGASSTNTLTIMPNAGVNTAITGSSSGCLVNVLGADWVRIDGSNGGGTPAGTSRNLTITNTNTGAASAVVCIQTATGANSATDNIVKNNNLVGTALTATTGTLFGVFSGSTTVSIASTGTSNNNNRIENNNIVRSTYGIYSGGLSAAAKNTGTVITKNVMNGGAGTNITTGGILANFENGIEISQNDISVLKHDGTTGTTTTAFGIALGVVPNNTVTVFTGSDVTNALVSKNKINGVTQLNSTGYSSFGIVVNTVTSGTTLLVNNMISGVRSPSTASDFSAGIVAGGGTGSTTQIYHNSVSMSLIRGAGATYPSYGLAINSGNVTIDIKNNIFSNTQTSGSTGKSYAIANASTTGFTNMTSSFNDFYVLGASSFVGQTGGLGVAGPDRLTLTDWTTTTGSDASPNSKTAIPVFVNADSDLHLLGGSTLLGQGTTPPIVTTDIDNDPRPATGPDMGADEVVQAVGGFVDGGTYYNALFADGDGLAANVTITNALYLTGIANGFSSELRMKCAANIVGGSSTAFYHNGTLVKEYCTTTSFTYPVGTTTTGNEYSPVTAFVTPVVSDPPPSLAVSVAKGTAPSSPALIDGTTLDRYWSLTETDSLTADLTFSYLLGDVDGIEANYQIIKSDGGVPVRFPDSCPSVSCVDDTAHTMTISGVSSFSFWTAGEPLAPTNTPALVGGHVVDNLGAPLAGVTMNLLDTVLGQNSSTITDTNGNYLFNAILTGREIVVTPTKNGYTFNPQSRAFGHVGDVANIDFAGTASSATNTVGSDFDGDGKADLSVFRPSDGTWYTVLSSTGVFKSQQWGVGTDRIVPADYDGDHVTDVAVFRPSNGTWYISQSSTSTLRAVNWGLADDVATPADFDGDGQADIAVWRPSNGTWYVIDSHNGQTRSIQWGTTGDRPVAADYDGDGTADFAVFRPSNGSWYVLKPDGNYTYEHWGIEEDRAVVGDYDGDHKADLAVFRPSTATWYVKLSSDNSTNARGHGTAADVLAPADYDGDGKTDRAVWQTGGDWNILRSTTNTAYGQKWGTAGDIPTTSAYVR